ncbi:hypothetical protein [Methanococcoides sp. FTZ1]|uniref:hypothetical protein n=1 Tax=Methanococcoides sp. FTZ1 TaxID=3439061 RepID=UPI003F8541D6
MQKQLDKDIDVLDLTNWEKDKLNSLQLNTIGEVLQAPEIKLKEAYYVGDKRARRIHNTAQAAVYEYLLG